MVPLLAVLESLENIELISLFLMLRNIKYYTILQNKRRIEVARGAPPPPPPPPIIFEPYILPQQTIYRWKENLTANRIHFKYLRNILISRFYEQFSLNGSAMAPERMIEKISDLKIMNILYIILKHVVWRFRIYIITFAKYSNFAKI